MVSCLPEPGLIPAKFCLPGPGGGLTLANKLGPDPGRGFTPTKIMTLTLILAVVLPELKFLTAPSAGVKRRPIIFDLTLAGV